MYPLWCVHKIAPISQTMQLVHTQDGLDDSEYTSHEPRRHPQPKPVSPTDKTMTQDSTTRLGWLIDIQTKIQQGYGEGYEKFAHIHNIK